MILFAFENAGPAHYCAPIIKELSGRFEVICLASATSEKILHNHGIPTQPYSKDIDLTQFKIIFLGTCCWDDQSIDKSLLLKTRSLPAKTIVAIEHWCFYRQRFTVNGELVIPDAILVNDNIAFQEAVTDGLPKKSLHALGNPRLEFIAQKKIPYQKKAKGLHSSREILYISEEYAKECPRGSAYDQGFTEYDALSDILSILDPEDHVTIKLHPSEPSDKYKDFLFDKDLRRIPITIERELNFETMVQKYDYVIGLGSMLLIEMAFFRADILSYRPNERQTFIGNKLGATHHVSTAAELNEILMNGKGIQNISFATQYKGSTQRIIDFIEEFL